MLTDSTGFFFEPFPKWYIKIVNLIIRFGVIIWPRSKAWLANIYIIYKSFDFLFNFNQSNSQFVRQIYHISGSSLKVMRKNIIYLVNSQQWQWVEYMITCITGKYWYVVYNRTARVERVVKIYLKWIQFFFCRKWTYCLISKFNLWVCVIIWHKIIDNCM